MNFKIFHLFSKNYYIVRIHVSFNSISHKTWAKRCTCLIPRDRSWPQNGYVRFNPIIRSLLRHSNKDSGTDTWLTNPPSQYNTPDMRISTTLQCSEFPQKGVMQLHRFENRKSKLRALLRWLIIGPMEVHRHYWLASNQFFYDFKNSLGGKCELDFGLRESSFEWAEQLNDYGDQRETSLMRNMSLMHFYGYLISSLEKRTVWENITRSVH